ncbi:uncharacterized protein LOC131889854 [Tigriopus californicus]|uniref:uncharacterized protein LOC131889854 n=1 Tax=Tigriopus californicus TaxID=6832 RepID=UPI0027DA4801|nr:uncharacterized protein LOC131889854 [Tigriopus californicus]
MDEPRSLSAPLSMRLRQWAVHHLDYPGPPISASPGSESGSISSHEEAWSEICVGSLSQQWRYLLEHVRSKPQVHHIRGNLILEHHRQKLQHNRPADLTLLPVIDTTLASEFNPELEDERTHLLAEYKDLSRRIQKSTLRMTQNETRIRQYRRDVRWQTDLARKTEMELHERRKSAQLLQKFAAQARGEVSRLSAWAKDLRDLARDESERSIFRSHLPEERLFAHDGKELKTSAQHAVKESNRLARNLLGSMLKDPQSVDNIQKEQFQCELGRLFHRLGALEIQNACLQEVDEQIAELSKLGLPSNIHEDLSAYWTDLETSGRLVNSALNPSGKFKSMRQMLVDFAQKHVQSRASAENTKGEIKANETEIAQALEQLRTAFMTLRSKDAPSDWERDNFMRWVELELVFHSGRAVLESLEEKMLTAQNHHQSVNEILDQFTLTWTQKSKDLSKQITNKLSQLEMLVAVNRSFFTERLHPTVLQIGDIIQTDLLQNSEWKTMSDLRDKLSRQLKQFLALPSIQSLETTSMARKAGSQRYQTASMSIHRLKRDHPSLESGLYPDPSRFLSLSSVQLGRELFHVNFVPLGQSPGFQVETRGLATLERPNVSTEARDCQKTDSIHV